MNKKRKSKYYTLLFSTGILLSLLNQSTDVSAEENTYSTESTYSIPKEKMTTNEEKENNTNINFSMNTQEYFSVFFNMESIDYNIEKSLLSLEFNEQALETTGELIIINNEVEIYNSKTSLDQKNHVEFPLQHENNNFKIKLLSESKETLIKLNISLDKDEVLLDVNEIEINSFPPEDIPFSNKKDEIKNESTDKNELTEKDEEKSSQEGISSTTILESTPENKKIEEKNKKEIINMTKQSSTQLADELYKEASSASSSSARWNASVKGVNLFPEETRFKEALQSSAQRQLSLGMDYYRKEEYESALIYLARVVNGPSIIQKSLKLEANIYKTEAESIQKHKSKDALYAQASSSGSASTRWNASVRGIKLFPNDSRFVEALKSSGARQLSLGMNFHRKGQYSSALIYYNRIVNGPNVVGEVLQKRAEFYKRQAENNQRLKTSDDLYKEATSSGSASTRWNFSVKGVELYPEERRFEEALQSSAQRQLSLGMNHHRKGEYESALVYFNRVVDGPNVVQETLKTEAKIYRVQAEDGQKLKTSDDLYKEASSSGSASVRWNSSVKGVNLFPGETRFEEALQSSAQRQLSLGMNHHRKGEYESALVYFNRVVDGPNVVQETLKTEAKIYKAQAENNQRLKTSDDLYKEATSSPFASTRWSSSVEGVKLYPNQERFMVALENSGNRQLRIGMEAHRDGKYNNALSYYRKILSQKLYLPTSIIILAESYSYLAENNLNIVSAIYEESFYNLSLDEMLNMQMGRGPQTDLYGGGWKNANREDVKYYLDAKNFLPKAIKTSDTSIKYLEVSTNTLNVRSGPGTNYGIKSSVHMGQIFQPLEESNGWFKINVNGAKGWISGAHVNLLGEPKEVQFADVPSSMLQFLKLSGTSGMSVNLMNNELKNAGILQGKGNVFIEASKLYNINDIYLMAHAKLETGNGSSSLAKGILVTEVDGVKVDPKVVYNMYGIGAIDSAPLKGGSEMAYKQGWDTPEKAILGGAEWISRRYINNQSYNQDTLYKMRWNPTKPGTHQYATDIGWAYKQTHTLNTIVSISQKNDLMLRFDIPIYR